jgi:hypothetical protein
LNNHKHRGGLRGKLATPRNGRKSDDIEKALVELDKRLDLIEKRQRSELELDQTIENFELELKEIRYRVMKLEKMVL